MIIAHLDLDAFFAAGKIGIVLVPLNTRLTVPELEFILTDCGVRAVMYDDTYRDQVGALKGRVPSVERWVSLDPSPDTSDDHWHGLVAAAGQQRYHGHRPAPEIRGES